MKTLITLVAALFLALSLPIVSGCSNGEPPDTIVTDPVPPTLPTIRLYSKYEQGGLDSMELSRVNGPYYLYGAPQHVIAVVNIAVANAVAPVTRLEMVAPDGSVSSTATSRMDIDLHEIGTYYFRITMDGTIIGEPVRLDVIGLYQKPVIEAYVETRRSATNTPGDVTIVSCLIKNTDTIEREIGVTISAMGEPGDRVDCQVASTTFTFGGNQGALCPGQVYFAGRSTLWRSTTNTTIAINDDVNTGQFFATLAPGESIRLICWFKTL